MAMNSLNGRLITRVRSAGSGAAGVAGPYAAATALKRLHDAFGMTGCNTNVWPLSPEDWLTG
jgi:hypothetical protein